MPPGNLTTIYLRFRPLRSPSRMQNSEAGAASPKLLACWMIWMEHYVTTNMVRRKTVQVHELLTIAARCHLSERLSKAAKHHLLFGSGSQQGFGLFY
jgi:hypothetical protein